MKKRNESNGNDYGFLRNVMFVGVLVASLFIFGGKAYSAEVTLAWSTVSDSSVAGYKIYYGTSKTSLSNSIKLSKTTRYCVSNLKEGNNYYFAATTYSSTGKESPLSNLVSKYIPVSSTNPAQNDVVYRINAGGPSVTVNGVAWSADRYSSGSSSTYKKSVSIGGTTNDVLYQTERYGKDFRYNVPVPAGVYTVKLHFAEIYHTSSRSRIFDVEVEGNQFVLRDLDLVSEVGPRKALVTTVGNVRVSDGALTVRMDAIKDNGKISAIEVNLVSASL